jgi:hypothetical protein
MAETIAQPAPFWEPCVRELLWQEMDQCLALAHRLSGVQVPSADQED